MSFVHSWRLQCRSILRDAGPGTQPSEIKPVLDRKICKVITAWEKLRKEMR